MRLINADKLLEDLKEDEEASKMPLMWHNGIMYAEEHINTAPTVDAVPVIRCKECKYWNDYYRECQSPNWNTGTDDYFVTPAGFYCGWAERKEE